MAGVNMDDGGHVATEGGALDEVGSSTLAALADARRYNRWQVDMIRPYLGKRILEIGSGIGNISVEVLDLNPERMVLTDIDPWYRERLKERFGDDMRVRVESLVLPDAGVATRL
ncbi:MAG TPA: hypothetical protein PLL69_01820, partial [Gemmatimonadales bacterium]|nr:hypothetical protein [Gemmatimonadales bacterium]